MDLPSGRQLGRMDVMAAFSGWHPIPAAIRGARPQPECPVARSTLVNALRTQQVEWLDLPDPRPHQFGGGSLQRL